MVDPISIKYLQKNVELHLLFKGSVKKRLQCSKINYVTRLKMLSRMYLVTA